MPPLKRPREDEMCKPGFHYWKSQGVLFPEKLNVVHIKTMIAVESSFNPDAKSKVKNSTCFFFTKNLLKKGYQIIFNLQEGG